MKNKIISLGSRERTLARTRAYFTDCSGRMKNPDETARFLFKALKPADPDLKLKIVLMLGSLDQPQVIWPLYQIMHDIEESDSIRYAAAVQLSVVGGLPGAPEGLCEQLKVDLAHEDPFVRASAAFALGWESNRAAVPDLIHRLSDDDQDVQMAAVNALINVGDGSVFDVLLQQMAVGSKAQRRAILYNLHHFAAYRPELSALFDECLQDPDPDFRTDALLAMDCMPDRGLFLAQYAQALQHEDARLRELSLKLLIGMEKEIDFSPIKGAFYRLLKDPVAKVRRAAVRLLHPLTMKIVRNDANRS